MQSTNTYLKHLNGMPRPSQKRQMKVISLFCGAGGLDLGLHFAGFSTLYASDIAKPHCETVAKNFPHCHAEATDVAKLSAKHIRTVCRNAKFDLLAGGPPCQAFSILGRRDSFADPRGQVAFEYIRLVRELKPRAFIFENVPGLLTLNGGADWRTLLKTFDQETKYKIFHGVINAADYGTPQIRKRLFVVGFKSRGTRFSFPSPTHRDPDSDASSFQATNCDLWAPARLAFEELDGVPNQRIRPHCERIRRRYSKVAPGDRCAVDHTDRVHPDAPSGTVLVGSGRGGGRPFIHPYENRHLTVREVARLQSFPDWYLFCGTNTWQYRGVGNAVPPLMAYAIGRQIRAALTRKVKAACH